MKKLRYYLFLTVGVLFIDSSVRIIDRDFYKSFPIIIIVAISLILLGYAYFLIKSIIKKDRNLFIPALFMLFATIVWLYSRIQILYLR